MIVAGVMSGTSADGINVALVKISQAKSEKRPRLKIIGTSETPYPPNVRRAVLRSMNAEQVSVADLARLNFLLGDLYADAILRTSHKFRVKVDLAGCHGQTLYHQGQTANYLGRKVAVTWQTGEGAVIAAKVGAPVVSDFRPADMAAGGKGAPLVPFLDYYWFLHNKIGRVVLNLGGIANLTAIPASASADQVIAFDTGPGNMLIDALMERFFGKSYDHNGRVAAAGMTIDSCLSEILRMSFFRAKPPKTAGREEFGSAFVETFLKLCGSGNTQERKQNIVVTATALTAYSIADALRRFVLPRSSFRELIASGGGCHNSTLMAMLANQVQPLGLDLHTTDEFGLASHAKEAVAFALLAYQTWNRQPSNVPSATGAKRSAILGKISYA